MKKLLLAALMLAGCTGAVEICEPCVPGTYDVYWYGQAGHPTVTPNAIDVTGGTLIVEDDCSRTYHLEAYDSVADSVLVLVVQD